MSEREQLTWQELGDGSRALAEMVQERLRADMVLAIARGGLLVAGAGRARRQECVTVNVESNATRL